MRIFYSAGNLIGANLRLSEFINNSNAEIKTAAYYKNHQYLKNIDFCLDALKATTYGIRNKKLDFYISNVDNNKLEILINYLIKFNPDLIITDYEPIIATLAKELSIPLWSCSPMHLLDGIDLSNIKNRHILKDYRKELKHFSHAKIKLIYSPFGLLNNCPKLNSGYKFVLPYSRFNKIKNIFNIKNHISNGETNCISNAIVEQKKIFIYNSKLNPESVINGFFVNHFVCGKDVGNISEKNNYLIRELEKFNNMNVNYSFKDTLPNYLHEEINEIYK